MLDTVSYVKKNEEDDWKREREIWRKKKRRDLTSYDAIYNLPAAENNVPNESKNCGEIKLNQKTSTDSKWNDNSDTIFWTKGNREKKTSRHTNHISPFPSWSFNVSFFPACFRFRMQKRDRSFQAEKFKTLRSLEKNKFEMRFSQKILEIWKQVKIDTEQRYWYSIKWVRI